MVMALDGIRVIDASQVAAVPMCARHLADYGADVIHIESAKNGDSWRNLQAGIFGGPVGCRSFLWFGSSLRLICFALYLFLYPV